MTEEKKSQGGFKIFLGVLVTIYGIATALVAYQSSELGSKATEMTFVGLMELTQGNDAYAVADTEYNQSYDAITQVYLLEETGGSQVAIDIWLDTLTDEAYDAYLRSDDVDDQYYDELYAYPNDLYDNAFLAYQTAQEYAEIGSQYEQIALMMAMGLAFVGWASILDGAKLLRTVFAILALLVLAGAVYLWWTTSSVPLSPEVLPLPLIE
ncbi:MAG TPA: hypothetical protein VLA32_05570 [Anaerolineales bacterium]|jgi:hypothetical protein|nr:hypothetical protein [Anaerolineales bacterium]